MLAMILQSCMLLSFNDNYEPTGINIWVWIICTLFLAVFIIIAITGDKQLKRTQQALKQKGKTLKDFKTMGMYVGGHPMINDNINNIVVCEDEQEIGIYENKSAIDIPKRIAAIPINDIISIQIEDASSIDKKITLGRVLLVGVFALAWRKNKKTEHAFVVITWKDGKFEHSSIFSFDGKDAMQQANTARNELIKMCKD